MSSPTLLIGLGEANKKLIKETINFIKGVDELVVDNLLSDFCIGDDKIFSSHSTHNVKPLVCELLTINSEVKDSPFQNNYNKFLDYETDFQDRVSFILSELMKENKRQILIEKDIPISKLQILLFADSFSAISSSILILVLKYLNKMGINVDVDLILFFPNATLNENSLKTKIEKSRTYCCLCELDYEFSKLHNNLARFVYIVEPRNENGATFDSIDELYKKIPELVYQYIQGNLNVGVNILNQLTEIVPGSHKLKRYSSFGGSKIYYPKNKTFEGLSKYSKVKILSKLNDSINDSKLDIQSISANVKRFINNNNYYILPDYLRVDDNDVPIYKPFSSRIIPDENTDIDNLIKETAIKKLSFKNNEFNIFINVLSQRQINKIRNDKILFKDYINAIIDSENNIPEAIAFLSVIQNQENDYLENRDIGFRENWNSVFAKMKEFYANKLEISVKENDAQELKIKISNAIAFIQDKQNRLQELNDLLNQKKETPNKEVNDLNTDDALNEINVIKENLKNKKKEVREYEKLNEEIKTEINKLNNKIEDANFRKELMTDEITQAEKNISDYEDALRKNNTDIISCKQRIDELSKKAHSLIIWLTIIYPSLILITYILLIILFPIIGILNYLFTLIPVSLVYVIYSWSRYNKNVGNDLKQAKGLLISKISLKKNLINQYIEAINYRFFIEFEHYLHSYAIEWALLIKAELKYITDKVKEFTKILTEKYTEYSDYWKNELIFDDDIFSRSVVNKDDCIRFYNENESSVLSFFDIKAKRTLSKYFNQSSGNESVVEWIKLDTAMNNYIIDIFYNISNKSVCDLILKDEIISNKLPIERRIKLLYSSAAPFIFLNEDNSVGKSELITNLFLKIEEDNYVERIKSSFEQNGVKNLFIYSTNNNTEISLINLRLGFGAYQIRSLANFKQILYNTNDDNTDDTGNFKIEYFFSDSQYMKYDIFPTLSEKLIYNNKKDLEFILLGRALDFIHLSNKGYVYGKEKLNNEEINNVINYFFSVKGEKDLLDLKSNVNKIIDNIKTDANEESKFKTKIEEYSQKNPDNFTELVLKQLNNYINISREF